MLRYLFTGHCPLCEKDKIISVMLFNETRLLECPNCNLQLERRDNSVEVLRNRGTGGFSNTASPCFDRLAFFREGRRLITHEQIERAADGRADEPAQTVSSRTSGLEASFNRIAHEYAHIVDTLRFSSNQPIIDYLGKRQFAKQALDDDQFKMEFLAGFDEWKSERGLTSTARAELLEDIYASNFFLAKVGESLRNAVKSLARRLAENNVFFDIEDTQYRFAGNDWLDTYGFLLDSIPWADNCNRLYLSMTNKTTTVDIDRTLHDEQLVSEILEVAEKGEHLLLNGKKVQAICRNNFQAYLLGKRLLELSSNRECIYGTTIYTDHPDDERKKTSCTVYALPCGKGTARKFSFEIVGQSADIQLKSVMLSLDPRHVDVTVRDFSIPHEQDNLSLLTRAAIVKALSDRQALCEDFFPSNLKEM